MSLNANTSGTGPCHGKRSHGVNLGFHGIAFCVTAVLILIAMNVQQLSRQSQVGQPLAPNVQVLHAGAAAAEKASEWQGKSSITQMWTSKARCDSISARKYLDVLERTIRPQRLLEELLQQPGGSWLQIGSNTMDDLNVNDPFIQLIDRIPTWKKVCAGIDPWVTTKSHHPVKRYIFSKL